MMKAKFLGKIVMAAAISVFAVATFLPGRVQAETNKAGVDKYAVSRLKAVEANYLASLRLEALQTKNAAKLKEAGSANSWMRRVNADEVNMATNRHEKKKQNAINMNGRPYYCSGKGSELTLTLNPSIRFAKDPLTNRRIDKSEAVIYADASGRAYYFESEDTYKGFIGVANIEKEPGYKN